MWPLLLFSLVYIFKIFKQSRMAKLLLISLSGFAHEFSDLVSINLAFRTGGKELKLTCVPCAGWNSWACVVLCCYCLRNCPDCQVTKPCFLTFLNSGFGWIFCLFELLFLFSYFTLRRKTKNFWEELCYHVLKRIRKFCRKHEGRLIWGCCLILSS